jgi:hypothetical protein
MHLLLSIMINSIMPLYGSSMTCVHEHMFSSQSSGMCVLLHITLGGISFNCESSGEDGERNEILLITAAV